MKCRFLLLYIFILLTSCQKEPHVNTLFKEVSFLSKKSTTQLSQLMSDSILITPLETVDESILGKINKIRKYKNEFYVLSNDQWIFRFDKKGKYVSSLKKRGSAPDEYTYINDFDVYEIDGINEVWVADNHFIKIYNAEDFTFRRKINLPFIVSKFKRLSKNEILLMNCLRDKSLFVVNEAGEVVSEALDKEVPYLLYRAVQFKNYSSDLCLFQLGISNDYVAYDLRNKSFEYGRFFDEDKPLVSKKELCDLFDKYGQGFIMNFKDYTYIQSYFYANGNTWFYIKDKEKKYITKISPDKSSLSAMIYPHCDLRNDLFHINDFNFLTTLGFGESDNSLLLYMEVSSLEETPDSITLKNGQKIGIKEEDNPVIIEFF